LAEEPEISAQLKEELSQRMDVYTGTLAEEVKKTPEGVSVSVKDKAGKTRELKASNILVAVGRISNADLLKPENTGVDLDKKGFIKVNEYMETSQKNIWAVGDINGLQMFTHAANREAAIAGSNAVHDIRNKVDLSATPHAIYSHPQIAAVGMGEAQAKGQHKIMVGTAKYSDIAKGEAMMEGKGFAKAIVEQETDKILGFHIIGPYAPELIQEVINAMASGGGINQINAGMHIHPALPELIIRTFSNLEEVK
jgi:mycothione reductase